MKVAALGSQLGDVLGELALEVGGFVLADGFLGGETVKHGAYGAQLGFGFSLVGDATQCANGIAGRLGVVAVVQATSLSLADSFD